MSAPEWTFDEESGAGYLRVRQGEVYRTTTVHDGLLVDLNASGELLGIEVFADTRPAVSS